MKNEKSKDLDKKVVKIHDVCLDSYYAQWLNEIKSCYRSAQIKASVKVNAEQLLFNWQLGMDLVNRKAEEQWGAGVVEQLSMDLQAAFPESKGFSTTNLWYMKQWNEYYPIILGLVPWGHHIQIISNCKSIDEALFYIHSFPARTWERFRIYGKTETVGNRRKDSKA